MAREIAISKIRTDGLQMRVEMNEAAVAEYAELMAGGAVFPPVVLFLDAAGAYWLADGFHRLEAAKRGGRRTVAADVRRGEWIDALRYALHANSGHGMRMTNADKRHALEVAWRERERLFGGEPSNALLAEVCGVSRQTVVNFKTLTGCQNLTPCQPPTRPSQGVKFLHPEPPAERPDEDSQGVKFLHPAETENGAETAEEPPKPPVRRIGRDGKAYLVRTPPPTRPARGADGAAEGPPAASARPGYYIGPDGREHASGVFLDRFNVEIPDRLAAAFRSSTLDDILAALQRARALLRRAAGANDPAVAAVSQRAALEMENAYHELKAARPHCVCRICQGAGCGACRDVGFQTEDQFRRNPEEMNP